MESKKTEKADLQNKKLLFFEVGLAVALLVTLVAFNWKSQERAEPTFMAGPQVIVEEENVPVTKEEPPKPTEIPKMAIAPEQIMIADNDIELEMDMSLFDTEENQLGIQPMDYVERSEGVVEEDVVEVIPFAIVEDKPTFMGGNADQFPKWVGKNVKYPESAVENNIQGTVFIQFTIGVDGTITSVRVLRSVDPLLDQEAVRVVKSSPRWVPGKQRNKPVPVSYQIPVAFRLQ